MHSGMPRIVFLLAVGLLLLTSCEHAGLLEVNGDEPTLEVIQATIFSTSCALSGCHLGANAQQGLDLSEGESHGNLVGVDSRQIPSLKRVDPGNPNDSYLVMKIEGDSRILGQRMPLGGQALSSGQIQLVRDWIASLEP